MFDECEGSSVVNQDRVIGIKIIARVFNTRSLVYEVQKM